MTKSAYADTPLLKHFRFKFVLVTMAFATVVVAVVIIAMAVWTYSRQIDTVYDALASNVNTPESSEGERDMSIGSLDDPFWDMGDDYESPQELRSSELDAVVATSTYLVTPDGEIQTLNESLALDADMVERAVSAALSDVTESDLDTAKNRISSLNLYYCIALTDDGGAVVSLASDNFVDQAMSTLLQALLLVCLVLLAVFFLTSVFLSRWAVRPVAKAWEQQSRFIADASHELKTPLTVILANNSLLASDPDASDEERSRWIENIESEGHLMEGLINDMLYLARSDAADSHVEYGEIDLSAIAMGSALQFEAVAFEHGVTLEEDVDQGIAIRADSARMQRLVGVLIDNACKYADPNTTVTVSLKRTDGGCRLDVHNRGPVIDPDDLPHLFDRFYRSDKARTRSAGGFGLGLAIAKSTVDDLGGTISANSSERDGTRFTVVLPIKA